MRIRFWGTRGSSPTSLGADAVASKLRRAIEALKAGANAAAADLPFHLRGTYGGNTSCLGVDAQGGASLILDAGSGLRELGRVLMAHPPRTHHLLLSHTHWDHVMGLPFLAPMFENGHRLVVYGCHSSLEDRIALLFQPNHFPVRFAQISPQLSFVRLKPERTVDIAGFTVTPFAQRHPGASYGYRVEAGGRSLVYSTDSEHKGTDDPRVGAFAAFCSEADLLVFDAMYAFSEAMAGKAGWGHSSDVMGIEIAKAARVRHLCLFHHDPDLDDEALDARFAESRRYRDCHQPDVPLALSMAYDGLEFEL